MTFVIYKYHKLFRWKLVHKNRTIAVSAEGFKQKRTIRNLILKLCDLVFADVEDLTIKKKK